AGQVRPRRAVRRPGPAGGVERRRPQRPQGHRRRPGEDRPGGRVPGRRAAKVAVTPAGRGGYHHTVIGTVPPHSRNQGAGMVRVRPARALRPLALLAPAARADKPSTPFRYPEARHGKGELRYVRGVPVLTVEGTPEEIGEQVGVLALKPARPVLEKFFERF